MRVLVTGGSGRLGRATIQELAARGYQCVNADQRSLQGEEGQLARHREVDLLAVGQVAGALAGCDSIVHLGAIPFPYRHADEQVFTNNVVSTFAVLQAASLLGVRKVVVASSVSALGPAWSVEPAFHRYAPVDEAHPLEPRDPYGLSKEVDERTCEMFHRRWGVEVAALRLHHITVPGESRELAAQVRERPETWRRHLWGYVDVRDAAQACVLALEAEGLGFEIFNVTAADTLSDSPTAELLERYCPGLELRRPIPGRESAWSIAKAAKILGYHPRHSWTDGSGASTDFAGEHFPDT